MSATSSSSDKFLFLFTTGSDDLSGVKSALQNLYKFPSGSDNTFETTGCSNFKSTFKLLAEKLAGPDPSSPIYKMPDPLGKVPLGESNTNTLIIVISGEADSTGLADDPLNPASPHVLWSDLRDIISGTIGPKIYPYQMYTEVHVVFVSPYCNSFLAAWDGSVPVTNGTLIIPQTTSDAIDQTGRETFLDSWTNHLNLATSVAIDSNGRISFNDIAASIHGGSIANYFRSVGSGVGGKYFPGYSHFEITDGSPQWWESPDIYINTPGNDFYNPGVVNTVFINVHTAGTHPIKSFWVGAKHFGSGLGPTDAYDIAHLTTADGSLTGILTPGDIFLHSYDLLFAITTTHRCVVARAKFSEILLTDMDDYSEWSIEAKLEEAQRNTDPLPTPPPAPEEPAPAPDEAQDPDPDPQPDPEDTNNTGDRSLKNLRGFKEHIYSILNTYREKRKFRLVLHKEFQKYEKEFKIGFFRVINGKAQIKEPLKIVSKPYPHIPFILESGEKADILFYFSVKPKARLRQEVKLPIEIMVELKGKRPIKLRKSAFLRLDNAFAPVGGITVKVMSCAYSIRGRVFNKKGKPVAGANVAIRTINGRQAAVLKTDKEGAYVIPGINPDAYRMSVSTKEWHTKNKIINIFNRDFNIDFHEGK